MKFLADMGISQSTVNWLKEKDHDAIHLQDEGLYRLPDSEIVEKAKNENRIVLTCDLDFGNIMAFLGETYPSIIIFRLENETPSNINRKLDELIERFGNVLQKGAIISVEEMNFRIRQLPIIKL